MHLFVILLSEASPPNRIVATSKIWVEWQVCNDALNEFTYNPRDKALR